MFTNTNTKDHTEKNFKLNQEVGGGETDVSSLTFLEVCGQELISILSHINTQMHQ